MANKIRIPYFPREICRQLIEALNRPWLGIPMTIEMPNVLGSDIDGLDGICRIRFESAQHFKIGILTGFSKNFGELVRLTSIEGSMKFPSQMEAVDFMVELQQSAGTIQWHTEQCDTRETLKFKVEGLQLERLRLNGVHRRLGLPTYTWDAPNHPFSV